jgi:transcriptional regulator
MYNLPYFKEEDKEVVLQFAREYPFAFLSGVDANNKPVGTQLPFFIDERDDKLFLSGHMMKNTDHHKAFAQNEHVLAVFTGPHCYVSATWYDNPSQASTWNYMSVHMKGRIRFEEGEALVNMLKRVTLYYEKNNAASSTVFDNLSEAYVNPLLKAIVAFEIEVTSVENVFKLSQNRNEKSYDNIIRELKKGDHDAQKIGTIMEQRRSKLFS